MKIQVCTTTMSVTTETTYEELDLSPAYSVGQKLHFYGHLDPVDHIEHVYYDRNGATNTGELRYKMRSGRSLTEQTIRHYTTPIHERKSLWP